MDNWWDQDSLAGDAEGATATAEVGGNWWDGDSLAEMPEPTPIVEPDPDAEKYAAMYQDANDLLRNAPIKALAGEKLAAQEAERQARNLATRFNARLGQEISAQVKAMDEVFRGYRAWREQQRSLSPNRTEIPGQMGGVALQQNRNPNAVDSSGRVTDEYKRVLSRMVEDNLRSGRS